MKKILAWLLVMVMALGLFGCKQQEAGMAAQPTETQEAEPQKTEPQETESQETEPQETEPQETTEAGAAKPLLYKVSDEKGNVIWLFGSIHVGREEYYPLPDYVMDAYNGSDALALEMDILSFQSDIAAQTEALQGLIYTDGTDISDHIPEELYDRAVTAMENAEMYYPVMDYYLPVMWFSMLQQSMLIEAEARTDLGIDLYFASRAAEDEKEVMELESAQFQYDMLGSFSPELQLLLLESAVEACEMMEVSIAGLNLLMNYWASGDETGFGAYLAMSDEAMKLKAPELYKEYNNAMIVSRNETMTRWAEDALASGKEVFICVGAAHVVGSGAMAENLRELGYTVELVR